MALARVQIHQTGKYPLWRVDAIEPTLPAPLFLTGRMGPAKSKLMLYKILTCPAVTRYKGLAQFQKNACIR